MFDIGFWEIIIVAIVALLVVGPDKLPGLIRETARWAARIRRYVLDTKRDLERQINMDEIERGLKTDAAKLENMFEEEAAESQHNDDKDQQTTDKTAAA